MCVVVMCVVTCVVVMCVVDICVVVICVVVMCVVAGGAPWSEQRADDGVRRMLSGARPEGHVHGFPGASIVQCHKRAGQSTKVSQQLAHFPPDTWHSRTSSASS